MQKPITVIIKKYISIKIFITAFTSLFIFTNVVNAQTTERPRPAGWNNLVYGGRFMDRFLPMQNNGKHAQKDGWGASGVVLRYVENGIENTKWSFWCASIKYEAGKYHMFTIGWPENSQEGHAAWPNSMLFRAK